MPAHPYYRGRTAALATRHGKHALIAPELGSLGLHVVLADQVDTDTFGTFTGDRARSGSATETAEAKARAALTCLGIPLGLASEGTFGPHPASPFLPIDVELIAFVDTDRDLVVLGRAHSTKVTWHTRTAIPGEDLTGFLTTVGFPEQGLVVHPTGQPEHAVKGITDLATLYAAIASAYQHDDGNPVVLATDLRAHHNPHRRIVIRDAATDLATRLDTPCPLCHSPGFGPERTRLGRPCADCDTPTNETAAVIHVCPRCTHEQEVGVDGAGDPRWCPTCNP